MNTLVLQSAAQQRPLWIDRCLASVREWAEQAGYGYQFMGDELFEFVPRWYLAKCGSKLPVATDLARLVWMQQLLQDDVADCVLWMDADVLVFAPQLRIAPQSTCLFGYEYWVQPIPGKAGFQVRGNVHNAVAAFRKNCPILPFLIEIIQRLMRRADPDHIAPQMMGPKLLSHLHNLADFELTYEVGALAPDVLIELASQPGAAMAALAKKVETPMLAANLAASTATATDVESAETILQRAIDALLTHRTGFTGEYPRS